MRSRAVVFVFRLNSSDAFCETVEVDTVFVVDAVKKIGGLIIGMLDIPSRRWRGWVAKVLMFRGPRQITSYSYLCCNPDDPELDPRDIPEGAYYSLRGGRCGNLNEMYRKEDFAWRFEKVEGTGPMCRAIISACRLNSTAAFGLSVVIKDGSCDDAGGDMAGFIAETMRDAPSLRWPEWAADIALFRPGNVHPERRHVRNGTGKSDDWREQHMEMITRNEYEALLREWVGWK